MSFDFNDIKSAPRIFILGNGGSHANSVHIANDLIGAGKPAFTIDPATLTALANDFGYYKSFEKWISVVGSPGDLLMALSGSGKSPNILLACEEAERIGMKVWRVFGADVGQDMQTAEEMQIALGHRMMKWLKSQ